ncbi:MAG TPA: SDR family oxidoreductase [Bacteroidota bacterium]|jgi:nucleoside-diphosphate-sugar epimerase|nr:SDR family oxidoreductase [Bacteroidota bacterium]
MKILIAGGAGYIGSALVPKLLDRGYDVDVIDLLWFGNNLPKEARIIQKDIFKLEEQDLKNYEQVIFLAGLSNDPMAEFSPGKNFISNAAAPAYLGYLAKRAGVKRFIYAGSCSVYGYTVNELYDEHSPAVSHYPYGISKLQGEQAVMYLCEPNFSVICFRQGTVCGFSPRMRLDLVINTMFKNAMLTKGITVNNPAIWRPILGVQDAVSAYVRAIEANNEISGIFNVASGNYTLGELGDIVRNNIESELKMDIGLTIKHMHDLRNYKVSFEKAEKVLSFKPKHDAESIVKELIVNRDRFKDFDNPKYYNIEVFKSLHD